MNILIQIFSEDVPDGLLEETKEIVNILSNILGTDKYKVIFSNEETNILYIDVKNTISFIDIENAIYRNTIKFSKCLVWDEYKRWPRPIIKINIREVNDTIIQFKKPIEGNLYKIDIINPGIPDEIFNAVLKMMHNLVIENNSYKVRSKNKLDDPSIFIFISRKTINDKLIDIKHMITQDKEINYEEKLKTLEYVSSSESISSSMLEKSIRLSRIAEKFFPEILEEAKYCKYDLCTNLVGEYTNLQGIVGSVYFKKPILGEQYFTSVSDLTGPNSMKLSLVDNLDKLCIYTCNGITFSSTRDPFALKRSRNLIIDISIHLNIMNLDNIIEFILDELFNMKNKKSTIDDILNKRLMNYTENFSNINSAIRKIVFWKDNADRKEEMKYIYNRLKNILKYRYEYSIAYEYSNDAEEKIMQLIVSGDIMKLNKSIIDEFIEKNKILGSKDREHNIAYLLYKLEEIL